MDKTDIIKMFETFDFENDVNFQTGWKVISKQVDERKKGLKLIQAKVFYFNNHVARMDFDDYLSWIKSPVKADGSNFYSVPTDTSSIKINCEKLNEVLNDTVNINNKLSSSVSLEDITKTLSSQSISCNRQQDISSVQNSSIDGGIKSVQNLHSTEYSKSPARDNKAEEECDLSFSQVAEMILSNKDIPGLKSLNISPSNAPPTPSVLLRKAKPWEILDH